MWLANLADLELHTSLRARPRPARPTILAFDLDPGPPATVVECARVALRLREAFEHLGLEAFPKTSGSKGMQVYVPLNIPTSTRRPRGSRRRSRSCSSAAIPSSWCPRWQGAARPARCSSTGARTTSTRRRSPPTRCARAERPTVSTPLLWDEVEAVAASGDPDELVFTSADVLERVAEHGDLFAPVETLEQELPAL